MFLALLAATPPLSTDMYLAAIPRIAGDWGVGKDMVTLTLVLWFASFSLFILVAGSLSDKYGRKPVLLTGLSVFAGSSFLCAGAQDVYQLILFRIFQGMGAGAPSAIVSLHWENSILVFGLLTLCVPLLVLALWLRVAKNLNPIY